MEISVQLTFHLISYISINIILVLTDLSFCMPREDYFIFGCLMALVLRIYGIRKYSTFYCLSSFCYCSASQGFQLIVLSERSSKKQVHTPGSNCTSAAAGIISSLVMSRPCDIEPTEEYFLSIGRVFHKISLSGSAITVTRYRPRYHYVQ
jgi:hypothetical protein